MGTSAREKPLRLAEKLLEIRVRLHLSQNEMLERVDSNSKLSRVDISKYERGIREPSLITLLQYARTYGVPLEILADDNLDLP